jgi:hypothetical protein
MDRIGLVSRDNEQAINGLMEILRDGVREQLGRDSAESKASRIQDVREDCLAMMSGVSDEQLPEIVSRLARLLHVDPATLEPLFTGELEGTPTVVFRKRKDFGFETLDQCFQDACDAAGGEWKDPPGGGFFEGPGCYFREGTSGAEKAATTLAYTWGIYECEAGIIGDLWGLLTGD